jgi:hypothetical protein
VFLGRPRYAYVVRIDLKMDLCTGLFLLEHLNHQRSAPKDVSFLVYLRTLSVRLRSTKLAKTQPKETHEYPRADAKLRASPTT